MRVGVFHPGTQHSWQTALAFQEAGNLSWYATSAFYDPSRWPYKVERFVPDKLSARLNREFRRRYHPSLNPDKVRQFGFWEWAEVATRRAGFQSLSNSCNEIGNRAFCRQMIRLIEREPVDVIVGYNTSSLEVFQWARKRGIRCVLDQTIGHPASQNQTMREEEQRHPEFFVKSYQPCDPVAIDRQNAEVAEADLVLAGSEFCANSMLENGCPKEKIRIVNYGYDETLFPQDQPQRPPLKNRPVQWLFVGEVGPRKGIAYLLQAFENIPANQAELTLVGRLAIPAATFEKHAGRVRHIPQVPRTEIARYFAEADCFVFPSLFEGSALVLNEACGAGLGIIQTDRAGNGARPGQNGLILGDISVDVLTQAIQQVVADPGLCERWQAASWAMRPERTWAKYRKNVAELVASF